MEEDFDVAVPMDRAATQTVSQQKKKRDKCIRDAVNRWQLWQTRGARLMNTWLDDVNGTSL